MNNLSEKEIIDRINSLKKEVNDPENDFAPLVAQEKLDEITDLEDALQEMRQANMKITPILNVPTVGERPKTKRNRMTSSRLFI